MKKLFIVLMVIVATMRAHDAAAGFGISPPYVRNEYLVRSAHFEQKIILVRSDPDAELIASAAIYVPGAEGWFSFDSGNSFVLPKGERQVPLIVRVDVPEDAPLGIYRGKIDIMLSPQDAKGAAVAAALGAQAEVYLEVVEHAKYSFEIRGVSISGVEEGRRWLWMFFPGKIRFTMKVHNTGNVPYAPTRVEFDVYDGERIVEKTRSTNFMKRVDAFGADDVIAELPTRLVAGTYEVRYRILSKEEIVSEGALGFSMWPRGSLDGYVGYGFLGLTIIEKAILVILFGAFVWGVYKGIRALWARAVFKV